MLDSIVSVLPSDWFSLSGMNFGVTSWGLLLTWLALLLILPKIPSSSWLVYLRWCNRLSSSGTLKWFSSSHVM